MRRLLVTSLIFFTLFFYGLILSQTRVSVVAEELEPKNHAGFYDYRGVTNVHSSAGIGSGTVQEIAEAAQDVGLDFVFISDLNVFDGSRFPDGYYRQLLVLNAAAYSYLDSRFIIYDVKRPHSIESLGQAQVILADLLSQQGTDAEQDFIILAHPAKPGYAWSGPYPSGLDGVEIINLKSVWQHAWNTSKVSFLWSAFVYPFNSQLALLRLYEEPQEELNLWDQLSSTRRTVGMVGADATAKTIPFEGLFLKFPSYQTFFSPVTNHVLLRSEMTGEVDKDRKKLLRALSDGQFYMCLDVLGNPKGFAAYIQDGERMHMMGSKTKWQPGMKIMVHLPAKPKVPFETAFLKDGQHIMSSNSQDTEFELNGPGVYRIVVRVFTGLTLPDGHRWVSWIYSNPFYVE
jgi:hypothetical protein